MDEHALRGVKGAGGWYEIAEVFLVWVKIASD